MIGTGDAGRKQQRDVFARIRPPRPQVVPPTPRWFLAATGSFVEDDELRDDRVLARVMAEDVAWRFGLESWYARRPPRWALHRMQSWLHERDVLEQERVRIARTAQFYGCPE